MENSHAPFCLTRFRAGVFLAAVSAAFFLPKPSIGAGQPCLLRDDALRILESKYAEVTVAVGLANNGGLVEILASKDGATWTILVTAPGGSTCMVSAGENWRLAPVAPDGPPA